MTNGYVRVYTPDHPLADVEGRVYEHRKVLHDAGIRVPAGHHVHHLNGDKTDNRIENLTVLSAQEHWSLHSKARWQAMPAQKKAERAEAARRRMLGTTPSLEARRKMSEAHKRLPPEKHSRTRPVIQWTTGGEFVARFPTIVQAAAALGIRRESIKNCVLGYAKTGGGFRWTYEEVPLAMEAR